VGRLAHQKGVDTLVQAVARMRSREARLLLVGDGPRRPELEAAIRRHGLTERARITGFRPHREIPAILSHADLFCLPSRYEELSSVLLEAMRAGLPIVATRVGGTPEAIGPAGRLVSPDDPDAVAQALDDLIDDPAEATRLGELAQRRSRRYEWSHLAVETLTVYRRVESVHKRDS
jgi:glycosyltransferase involved in cell wall biosynthesis